MALDRPGHPPLNGPMIAPDPVAEPGKSRYRRGTETRERIIMAALPAFGLKGFQAVSTREIALAANVNLPAIQYYFGNKQGLYQACAGHIVARYRDATLGVSIAAQAAWTRGAAPAQCRQHLRNVLLTLARFLMDSDESLGWSLFIQRELADPGAAFDILFEQLWQPGVELVGRLIAAARDLTVCTATERLEAVHMISGLTAFASGRAAIDRLLAPSLAPDALTEALCRLVERQIAGVVPISG